MYTRMEAMGVISPIQEPTLWCAGMVVIPKRSGAVRICVDLKPLNESVLCEPHPIPKVDETLAQASGAKIFSKLDVNSGFWQIPLAKELQALEVLRSNLRTAPTPQRTPEYQLVVDMGSGQE